MGLVVCVPPLEALPFRKAPCPALVQSPDSVPDEFPFSL